MSQAESKDPEWETMLGYCMSETGEFDKPVQLESEEQLMDFVVTNVEKFHELRLTDLGDSITMQIINRALVFPLSAGQSPNNKWNAQLNIFVPQEAA